MKTFAPFALIAALLVLTGCPYSSEISLTPGRTANAQFLSGGWDSSGDDYSEAEHYDISVGKDQQLSIVKSGSEDGSVVNYKGYLSDIEGTLFLNVHEEVEPGVEPMYYFYKIDKTSDTEFVLFEVTENIRERFGKPEEMVKFFRENMHLSFFYTAGEVTYYKKS